MKTLILFIISLLTLCACSSSRKTTESSRTSQSKVNVNERSSSDNFTRIDTTKSSEYEFTYTKIEFYNPAGNGKEYKSNKEATPEEELEVDEVELVPGNSRKPPNGGIKSIEQWSAKKKEEAKGRTEASANTQSEKDENVTTNDEVAEKEEEEVPVPDPNRWKYIFYLALLGVGVFIYIKRTPIFKAIKKFFFKV